MCPKISKKIGWDQKQVDLYLEAITFFTESCSFETISVEVEKDPNDAPILETLIKSHVDFLVTGDKVLLDFQSAYSILSVTEFYTMME